MKKHFLLILCLMPMVLLAQKNIKDTSIAGSWKEVERLFNIKNYTQTLPLLNNIKAMARKENKPAQYIRAILAESQILQINSTKDDTFLKVKNHFEQNIAQTEDPVQKSILQNCYAQYLNSNNYRYSSQSNDPFVAQDPQGKSRIIDSIFALSITNRERLEKEPIKKWQDMFAEQKNTSLTPTLFHFFVHPYLLFLRKDESANSSRITALTQDLQQLNDRERYSDATAYLMSYTLPHIRWNPEEQVPAYLNVIDRQKSNYNAFLLYEVATAYKNTDKPKEAVRYLDQALRDYPESPWINDVKNLENDIKKTAISLELPVFAPSEQYTPIKISGNNLDTLYIRVYRTTDQKGNKLAYRLKYDSLSQRVDINAPLVYEESIALKSFGDYTSHRTIYKLNPLPYGNYTILTANNAAFKDDGLFQNVVNGHITISDIFVSATRQKDNNKLSNYRMLLINRKTGIPYAGKNIQVYDYSHPDKPRLLKTLTTNSKGEFDFRLDINRYSLSNYVLFLEDEKQFIDLTDLQNQGRNFYFTDDTKNSDEQIRAQILTDRAIYRPGQTIYFKSILYDSRISLGKVLENKEITLELKDANGQNIDSLTLRTNVFGSANGSFNLPNKILAGTFRINVYQKKQLRGAHHIRVEEYKRPTFKATFDPNKETYSVTDTAIFTGKAESLSGAPLIDASVRYKISFYHSVKRTTVVYADTLTETDDKGMFLIKVPLMDTSFAGLTDYTLQYTAEVTNQTGEMQSTSGNYRFTTKPWNIMIQTDNMVEEKKWKHINILTRNQNGQPLSFAGKVNIYIYEDLDATLADQNISYFRDIDYHLLDGSDYKKYFPNYFDKMLLLKETPKKLVRSYDFDTRDTSLVQLDSTLFTAGSYLIEAMSIQGNDTIRTETETDLYEKDTRRTTKHELLRYHLDKTRYDISDKITITFQSDVSHAQNIYLFTSHASRRPEMQVLNLDKGKVQYSFTLPETFDSQNLSLTALLIIDNKATVVQIPIPIQRTDRDLTIKTETFRDRITPGQKEKWRFSILKKDKVLSAEVLATMYDMALDEFAGNSFPASFGLVYPYSSNYSFYHLGMEFFQQHGSKDLFTKYQWYDPQGTSLSIIQSYGLLEGYFTAAVAQSSSLEEVVVLGYGSRAKRASIGATANLYDELKDPNLMAEVDALKNDVTIRGMNSLSQASPLIVVDGETMEGLDFGSLDPNSIARIEVLKDAAATAIYGSRAADGVILVTTKEGLKKQTALDAVQARTDLRETAFFYPELYTDSTGNVSFEFDSPEALTTWKLLLFAHSKNLDAGQATLTTRTQKQLMVRPNLPRYFREGDSMTIKAQVQNLSKDKQSGQARIEIIDPENNQHITPLFVAGNSTQDFAIEAENNGIVQWQLRIPADHPTVLVKIVAATDAFSDGEQHELPILSNKVLVSDTERIILKSNETKDYSINGSGKDNLHAKVQVQTNPILEILSALDFLKNYPYECSEQTASKWFSLKMVQYIQKHYPAIADYFTKLDTATTKGKLEENTTLSELKQEEMPWLRDIQGEQKKIKTIALLFSDNVQSDIVDLERKLGKNQLSSGAFPWFEDGKANTSISIRILEIIGKVYQLEPALISNTMRQSAQKLVKALDGDSTIFNSKKHNPYALDYLYARHYWNSVSTMDRDLVQKLNNQLLRSPEVTARGAAGDAARAWIVNQIYGEARQTTEIKNRIQQEAISDGDKGMYWESNQQRYNATSLHSYMVEAFKLYDPAKLHDITQWIYYSKEANHWQTTWMTVDAIYALLSANNPVDFALENSIKIWVDQKETAIANVVLGQSTKDFKPEELRSDTKVTVQNNNSRTVYGSIVHQYLAPLEAVSSAKEGLSVQKQYLVERQGKWVEAKEVRLGERIKVRLTLINDNPLEYVHLKDARPSGVEQVYRPSGHDWRQDYYFTMKDASTNYFFDHLSKGRRELEYEVKANNAGVFHSGITNVECMYDPAVSARSNDVMMTIKE